MSFSTNSSPYQSSGLNIPTGSAQQNKGGFGQGLKNFGSGVKDFFLGKPGYTEQLSTLDPRQRGLSDQLQNALSAPGAGGTYGDVADYYRGLLSNQGGDFDAYANPELRRFNEDTIPGLAEQFAGMGSGGLSSSGFRNAATSAGTDLGERLGAIRAQLRQQAAQGLTGLGSQGFAPTQENVQYNPTQGFISQIAPALGGAIGAGSLGGTLSSLFSREPRAGGVSTGDTIQQGRGGQYPQVNKQYNPYTDNFGG